MNTIEDTATQTLTEHSKPTSWTRFDLTWVLGIYGSAVGAGVLFLPIKLGMGGFWVLLVMSLLAFPMTYLPHRALTRFVLSGRYEDGKPRNIIETAQEKFGSAGSKFVTLLYLVAVFPTLSLYIIALTNTLNSFVVNQLGYAEPPRAVSSLLLILLLMIVVRFGHDMVVRAMAVLVYPVIAVLLVLAVLLVPHWNSAFIETALQPTSISEGGQALWATFPFMVMAFGHMSIISAFAVSQRLRYGAQAEPISRRTLAAANALVVLSVMFFIYSCLFALTPADLQAAQQKNVSVLSYIAIAYNTPLIASLATLVVLTSLIKAFLSHYIGASEGFSGLVRNLFGIRQAHISDTRLTRLGNLVIVLVCWGSATYNPNILTLISSMIGPVITLLLFCLPMYAIYRLPELARYRRAPSNYFVMLVAVLAVSSAFLPFFHH